MMYINTLKKREPEFVWELKQSALRCRLLNEQRKKNGLEPLGHRGRIASKMVRNDSDEDEGTKERGNFKY
jgi:hypothetical protein